MSAKRAAGEGLAFGLGLVVVGGAAAYFGWRWLEPQIVGIAGAAGSAAGEEASHQITTGIQGQAPAIGAEVGRGAVQGAKSEIGETLGGSPLSSIGGPVTLGGVPVEVT